MICRSKTEKEMKKKKPESPYVMRTIRSAKVQGIKIYLKRYETKPIFMMQPQEHRVLFWLVTSSARFNRKFTSADMARACFAQLIEFEKHKTMINFYDDGKVIVGGIVSPDFTPEFKVVDGVPVCVNANPSERVLKLSSDGKWIDVTEHPDTAVW